MYKIEFVPTGHVFELPDITAQDLKEKFPLTVRRPLNVYELTEEAYEALFERNEPDVDSGYILLCHEGCRCSEF